MQIRREFTEILTKKGHSFSRNMGLLPLILDRVIHQKVNP